MTPYIVQLHQAIANGPLTSAQAAESLGWPKTRAYTLIRQLMRQGLIKPVGNASMGFVYGVVA